MKEVLNAMMQAVSDQAIALGAVDERVTALKRTLAGQFPDLADELKGQIDAEQEQSRSGLYELQVTLARVREAIAAIPEAKAEVEVEKKRGPAKAPSRAAGKLHRSRQ